jgi:hypothetical protein
VHEEAFGRRAQVEVRLDERAQRVDELGALTGIVFDQRAEHAVLEREQPVAILDRSEERPDPELVEPGRPPAACR